jgi:hypothetical protein
MERGKWGRIKRWRGVKERDKIKNEEKDGGADGRGSNEFVVLYLSHPWSSGPFLAPYDV